jgi:hypothetical protein
MGWGIVPTSYIQSDRRQLPMVCAASSLGYLTVMRDSHALMTFTWMISLDDAAGRTRRVRLSIRHLGCEKPFQFNIDIFDDSLRIPHRSAMNMFFICSEIIVLQNKIISVI